MSPAGRWRGSSSLAPCRSLRAELIWLIDIATHALPGWLRRSRAALTAFGTVAVAALIAYSGGAEALHIRYEVDQRSMSGVLPAFIGYAVLPVAFTLLAFAAMADAAIKTPPTNIE